MRRQKRRRLLRNTLIGLGTSALAIGLALVVRKRQDRHMDDGLSVVDQDFVRQAAQDGLLAIQLGHLAGQRGQSKAMRELGQRLIRDHGRSHSELVSLALARGFVPPGHLPVSKRSDVERLALLPRGS